MTFRLVAALVGCAVCASPFVARANITDLLEQESRPTMAQIEASWGAMSKGERKAFTRLLDHLRMSYDIDERSDLVNDNGPEIIAMLETAFPGATWAVIGRDAALVGDMLDAFYRAQGQTDRVAWIPFGSSIKNKLSRKALLALLQQHGLRISDPKAPPFVLLDGTSYRESSQTRMLLQAGYAAMEEFYGPDLKHRLNAVNLYQYTPDNVAEIDRYFEEQRSVSGVPSLILEVYAEDLTHGPEWHEPFRITTAGGKRMIVPGDPQPQSRLPILIELLRVREVAQSAQFLRFVKHQAKKMGASYPPKEREKRLSLTAFPKRMADIDPWMKRLDDAASYAGILESLRKSIASKTLGPRIKEQLVLRHLELFFQFHDQFGDREEGVSSEQRAGNVVIEALLNFEGGPTYRRRAREMLHSWPDGRLYLQRLHTILSEQQTIRDPARIASENRGFRVEFTGEQTARFWQFAQEARYSPSVCGRIFEDL